MNKLWSFPEIDKNKSKALSAETGLSRIIVELLLNRGIQTLNEAKLFFNPSEEHFHDPFLLNDMEKAIEIVFKHIEKDNRILIYGDYDVDGTTSTSILYLTLKKMGARVTYYIPKREEGYGLSIKGIESAKQVGISLIISCDCGITAHKEVEFAMSNGIEVIITDHHEAVGELPNAAAVVDPKRPDSSYPFRNLSGAGVAFKFVQAIRKHQDKENWYAEEFYDLAALGTAADIVPMTGENRVIVSLGLPAIFKGGRVGLKSLLRSSGFKKNRLTVSDVIFKFGPRINAVGRIGDAREAAELFTTNNFQRAEELAKKFEILNTERRAIDMKTFKEAEEQLLERYDPDQFSGAVLYGENWHQGVIGIVASRITEKYHRPAVMISLNNGIGRGSGRSIPGFNLHEALKECSDLLIGFGGHEQAGGLTIERSKLQEFVDTFDDVVAAKLTDEMIKPTLKVESKISFGEIDKKLLETIRRLEPYGVDNAQPIFVSEGVEIEGKPLIVGDNHLKMKVKQGGILFDTIGFNMAEDLVRILNPPEAGIKLAYEIEENEWNGRKNTQLVLKDIQL
ncbi:MAG: single-stranded-DNA-specific exonuclease RecJ [Candidatus Marinimicrobia bacterium]|nr:single-stranded-DNA-specific exonuclease RecJ [Candidatus Neomarinimicrobiota bacterium]